MGRTGQQALPCCQSTAEILTRALCMPPAARLHTLRSPSSQAQADEHDLVKIAPAVDLSALP